MEEQERVLNAHEKIVNTVCLNNGLRNYDGKDINAYEYLVKIRDFLDYEYGYTGKDKLEILEALEAVQNKLFYNKNIGKLKFNVDKKYHEDCRDEQEMMECLDILLKGINNVKPTTPYCALNILLCNAKIESGWQEKHCITYAEEMEHNDRITSYYNVVLSELNSKSKPSDKEMAFDVIFKKKLDVFDFIRDIVNEDKDYEWYKMHYEKYHLDMMEKDTFNFIKRMLKEENN